MYGGVSPSRAWVLLLPLLACAHRAHGAVEPPGGAFPAETLAGERVEIGGPGPVRLVELGATWCEPCGPATERARPVLARHPRVVAYAIALDTDRQAVARHLAATAPLGIPLLYRGGAAGAKRRGFDQVPTFVALDARGRVAGSVTGLGAGLAPALDRLLSQAEGRPGLPD